MKTLRFVGTALLAVVLCVNFAACSDDDGEKGLLYSSNDVIGVWQCVSQTGDDCLDKFIPGDIIKFFDSEYVEPYDPNYPQVVFGKNYYINWVNGWHRLDNYTEYTLEEMMSMTEDDFVWCDAYAVEGNTLTLYDSDLDRYIGIIVIEGNTMTYSYIYQNWNADSEAITEEFGPFTATFQKK